jgi:hypothetical protein
MLNWGFSALQFQSLCSKWKNPVLAMEVFGGKWVVSMSSGWRAYLMVHFSISCIEPSGFTFMDFVIWHLPEKEQDLLCQIWYLRDFWQTHELDIVWRWLPSYLPP